MKRRSCKGREPVTGPGGRNSLPFPCFSRLRALSCVLEGEVSLPKNQPDMMACEIELPQAIIETFARFLVPEMRKYYDSEQGRREFAEWQEAVGKTE